MSRTTNIFEYHPLSVAAEQLATTEMKILMLLKKKVLTGEFIDGSWFVTADSLANYHPSAEGTPEGASCRKSCSSSICGCR